MMSSCTFFGHRECYELDVAVLRSAIEVLISKGVDTFYVGNQGHFDKMVYGCLKQLRKTCPHICVFVVLAYFPGEKREGEDDSDTIYPEIEGHPKFAIERRNKWMIYASEYCVCYISHTWGGAYKFARLAKHNGRIVTNLGKCRL